jgi:hypothetical protein
VYGVVVQGVDVEKLDFNNNPNIELQLQTKCRVQLISFSASKSTEPNRSKDGLLAN